MKQDYFFGDTVANQERVMRESLRLSGCARDAESDFPVDGIGDVPTHSVEPHPTMDERPPAEMLNWNNGEVVMTPCHQGAEPLGWGSPIADGKGNARFGVDEVVGTDNGSHRG
jgi:hypothetical protein